MANRAPVVFGVDKTVSVDQSISVDLLFSASDPNGQQISAYEFFEPEGGGYLSWQSSWNISFDSSTRIVTVPAAELNSVEYIAGERGSEILQVRASDGSLWSDWANLRLTTAGLPISGGSGNDWLYSSAAAEDIVGGLGIDTVYHSQSKDYYAISKTLLGYSVSSPSEGTDLLTGVERLEFSDRTVALDIDGNAGQTYRLYQAAFARTPDNGGLKYWIQNMDNGMTLEQVSAGFLASNEFKTVYGANPSMDVFITNLYSNVLHREPDQGGYNYWAGKITSHAMNNEQVLIGFSESNENQLNVIGAIQNGIELY